MPSASSLLLGFEGNLDFRAGGDEDDFFGLCSPATEHIAALGDKVVVRVRPTRRREVLAREGDQRRALGRGLERNLPGFRRLDAIGRAEDRRRFGIMRRDATCSTGW